MNEPATSARMIACEVWSAATGTARIYRVLPDGGGGRWSDGHAEETGGPAAKRIAALNPERPAQGGSR
jgi:hypothetical protein